MTDKPTIPPDFEAATQYRIRLEAVTAERDAINEVFQFQIGNKRRECETLRAERDSQQREAIRLLARVQALEAHLRKADRIEGDIGAEQWYAERDALLGPQQPEIRTGDSNG